MKKTYIALAMLFAASSMNSMGAKTEAEFNSAKEAAIAKVTSWSSASPYAPDAFSKGLTDLENTGFSSYSDGDAAVKAVDDIVSATLASAREEILVKMPTIFVTMTTDALTANPVDGGNLVGTPYEDRHYNESFKTYSKPCQGSAWLIFEQATNPGKWAMRNNIVQYIASRQGDEGEPDRLTAAYNYNLQPDIEIDFADNGKMQITVGSKYIGTDETGGLAYYESFCDATSWTFARAYDEKHDLPRLSTEEDPVWYVFRNASVPDDGFLTGRYPNYRSMVIGPISESAMWRFGHCDLVPSDWVFAYNKSGYMMGATTSGHAECGTMNVLFPYMQFAVIDGYEQYGLIVCLTNQSRMLNFTNLESYNTGTGCPWLLTKAHFGNLYTIDLSWQQPGVLPDGCNYWFIEEAGDAGLLEFLSKRNDYSAEVRSYTASQPWAHTEIEAAAKKIDAVEFSGYSSAEEAIAAIRAMADEFLATLPALMVTEGSSEGIFFSLNNVSLMNTPGASGWMVATDDDGNFIAISTNTPGENATWSLEKVTDTTFRLKNRAGLYVGTVRSGQAAKSTDDAASAATFSFIFSDGRVVLKSTRSCLSMDAAGSLTAAAETDPSVKWVLKNVVVMEENDIVTSDISNQWLYTITSVSDPLVYFESEPHRYYCYARGYLTELSYWFLENITNGDGGYRFVGSINASSGTRMCRNPRGDGSFDGPVCYDKTQPTSSWAVENWYVVPVEYDGKRAYQITTCYPPKGNCYVSRQMINGVMTYSSADDLENTAWYFNHVEGIDHEGMFNNKRWEKLADLNAFIRVQPFAQDLLTNARDYVENASMNDFGPDYYSSYSNMIDYVYAVIEKAKWMLEDEPRYCTVRFRNVRRAENGSPAYLAAVNGHANTVDLTDDEAEKASAWLLEYYANGCYRLKNDNGGYLGKLSSDIEIVDDPSQAGLYFLDFRNYYMTVADRNNPEIGINVDQSGNNACVYDSNDGGSRWTIEFVRPSGIDTVTGDSFGGETQYFNLNGIRVSPDDLVPGIYIRRQGSRVSKVLVK